jgi:hypothetical protein
MQEDVEEDRINKEKIYTTAAEQIFALSKGLFIRISKIHIILTFIF